MKWETMTHVVGIDEVGRGPLAGPVVAAAVILDPASPIEGLADSKVLTERRREQLFPLVQQQSLCWALGRAEVEEIDELNIFHATMLAMRRAVEGLSLKPEYALVDGNHYPQLPCPGEAVVKGDQKIAAISAASIIAKVTRDREMVEMEIQYPGYGLAQHKGYPTKQHIAALEQLGVTPIHRRSFGPVTRLLDGV